MSYDSVIFDIDGTLWTAITATTQGWNQALKEQGYERRITEEQIRSVTGLPFDECVKILFPEVAEDKFEEFFAKIDEHEANSVKELGGKLFPHVAESFPALARKFKIALISNCQDWYLESFMKNSGLAKYIEEGTCLGHPGKSKVQNMHYLMEKYDLKNPVYVGDTEFDQKSANTAGIGFIHAKYGFGKFNSEYSFDTFKEIADYLLKL